MMFSRSNSKTVTNISALLVLSLLFASCISLPVNSSKSGKKLFVSFFMGDGVVQYFIKPFKLDNQNSKNEVEIDFTFRLGEIADDSCVVNLSYFNIESSAFVDVTSISLSNNQISIDLQDIEKLYTEKISKKALSRFTSQCKTADLEKLLGKEKLILYINNNDEFNAGKKELKDIKKISSRIF